MYKPSLLAVMLSGLLASGVLSSGLAFGETKEGRVNIPGADSTVLTVYHDKALINQAFKTLPGTGGLLEVEGMPDDWQEGSLELGYRDGDRRQLPERVWWPKGGLDRDLLYRRLVGKTVEVIGGGLNVAVQGVLITYDRGMGLVQGSNGREYLVDFQDHQGFRIVSRDSSLSRQDYLPFLMADFGQQEIKGTLKLSYITHAIRFSSEYRLTIEPDQRSRLELRAIISNHTDADYSNAKVRLVSGNAAGSPGLLRNSTMMEAEAPKSQDSVGRRVGEVLVTSLPEPLLLTPQSSHSVSLHHRENLTLEKRYVLTVYGHSTGSRGTNMERPKLTYRFKTEVDLPGGAVNLYEEGPDGVAVISGHGWLPKTTAGDMARLNMGEAIAVRVDRSRVEAQQKPENELLVQWRATIHNDQKEPVTLLLVDRDRNLLKISNLVNAEKEAPGIIRVTVPAGSQKKIGYSAVYSR